MARPLSAERILQRAIPRQAALRASNPMQRLIRSGIIFLLVLLTAVIGYRIAGWPWVDSLYMVVITVFSVGYDEVRPVDTMPLRTFTILVIVFGYAAAVYVVGGFVQMLINGELNHALGMRKMTRQIEQLQHHAIICGYGRMGHMLADELAARQRPLVIIERDESRAAAASDDGHLVLCGNATEEDLLRAAGAERSSVLATVLSDDAANVFITITARQLNPKLQILARGEQSSTVSKLRLVGADHVILPTAIGADRLAKLILRPTAEALLREARLPAELMEDLESIGLQLNELELRSGSPLCDHSVGELTVRGERTFLVVALRRASGPVEVNPSRDVPLRAGDSVIVLGHRDDIPELCSRYDLESESLLDAPAASTGVQP